MGRGIKVLCCSWIAIQIAAFSSISLAQTRPSTQPDTIVECVLEDPLTSDSKCYLDLDAGNTFQRGETQADMVAAKQLVRDHGIDLMCESRQPARGFVIYGMNLKPCDDTLDHPPGFVELRRMFEKIEPVLFDFVTPDSVPKSYRFRTADGTMGVLQVVETMQNPSGLRLRYRRVSEPPLPPLVRNPNSARAAQYAMIVARQELQVKRLRETYGDTHPNVIEAQRQLDLAQDIAKLAAAETDVALFALKSQQIRNAYQLALLREKFPDSTPVIKSKLRDIEILKTQIQNIQARPRPQQVPAVLSIPAIPRATGSAPTTHPVPVNPATQPFAKDFHL